MKEGTAGGRTLLRAQDIHVRFPAGRKQEVHAVDGISFDIAPAETLALVGESGCGKSTIGRSVLALEQLSSGLIEMEGQDLARLSNAELRKARRHFQFIPQDPFASLNPKMTIGQVVTEPLIVHHMIARADRRTRTIELVEMVGLPAAIVDRRANSLSGGQRQRVSMARAMAVKPRLIVCDEPTSSLDVSVRAQMVELFIKLQATAGVAYLFISHDLASVSSIADRVGVVYAGQLVEIRPAQELFQRPLHPYTRALIAAVPIPNPRRERNRERLKLAGEPPSPISPPGGCRFHPRCPYAREVCAETEPRHEVLPDGGSVKCHFWREINGGTFAGSPEPVVVHS